ncbi:MAG: protein phosphatase 2C domain-containing protein [Clostridia bacterium]|nr:protein phosphatase 2C domain-containing protein [Clostridia bacterium]
MILQKWKQCGAVLQGKDHVAAGVVCQDNVASASANGVHAIALSDGGGSRKFSQVGSEHSTRAVCQLLTEKFDDFYERQQQIAQGGPKAEKLLLRLKLEILDTVLDALRAQVTAERALPDFGCTLQFAAVKNGRYIAGHVGDGVIAALYQRGLTRRVEVLSHPENGDGPNITFFVTDHNAKDHLRLVHGECFQLEGILMMSDGPEEVLYNATGGMHQNTLKLFDNYAGVQHDQYAANLERFLSRTVSRQSFDDLSVNLLYLETVDSAAVSGEYKQELFEGITTEGQIKRISHHAYQLDPTMSGGAPADLAQLGR